MFSLSFDQNTRLWNALDPFDLGGQGIFPCSSPNEIFSVEIGSQRELHHPLGQDVRHRDAIFAIHAAEEVHLVIRHLQILDEIYPSGLQSFEKQDLEGLPDLRVGVAPIIDDVIELSSGFFHPSREHCGVLLVASDQFPPPVGFHKLLPTRFIVLRKPKLSERQQLSPELGTLPWSVRHIAPKTDFKEFDWLLLHLRGKVTIVHQLVRVSIFTGLVGPGSESHFVPRLCWLLRRWSGLELIFGGLELIFGGLELIFGGLEPGLLACGSGFLARGSGFLARGSEGATFVLS